MIKINLVEGLSNRKTDEPLIGEGFLEEEAGRETIGLFFSRVLIMLVGPIGLYFYSDMMVIPNKIALIEINRSKLNEFINKNNSAASAVMEMKNFQRSETRLKEQIEAIENLRRDRLREVKILDLIQREMPEQMWLTKVEYTGEQIRLDGVANSSMQRNQLVEALNKSDQLQDINILRSSEETIENRKVEVFSLELVFSTSEGH